MLEEILELILKNGCQCEKLDDSSEGWDYQSALVNMISNSGFHNNGVSADFSPELYIKIY